MNQELTDITIVLDRSGSMQSVANDTIGGFNRFLKDQREAPGHALITLHQFDDQFETVICAKSVKEAKELTHETFVPRGSTALFDAMGRAINETGKRLARIPAHKRPAKAVFVVITDGFENASKEFTKEKVRGMIEHQRSKYAWEFVFLGANQDAVMTGVSFGFVADNSMTYANNAAGVNAVFACTSANLVSMRSGASATMSYSAAQREEQEDAGA